MKKIICALAAAGFLIVNSQAAMAFSVGHGQITYGDPTGKGVYLGENMYLQKDSVLEDGQTPGNDVVYEAERFAGVKTIAIAPVDYYHDPRKDKEPTWQETSQMIDELAKSEFKNENIQLLTFDEVADRILRETGEDIVNMPPVKRNPIFRKYVSRYADAYATITVPNGSKDMMFSLNITAANDGKLLYKYNEAVASYNGRDNKTFQNASKNVIKAIDQGYKRAIKEAEEKKKKGLEWKIN